MVSAGGQRDVQIRDVTPRDGLQSEAPLAAARRAALANELAACGLAEIEVVSFVSPTAVPAMANATEVVAGIDRGPDVTWWALVPNRRGTELAIAAGLRALTITVSASDGYSQKNLGRPTAAVIAALPTLIPDAPATPLPDSWVSTRPGHAETHEQGGMGEWLRLDVVVSCAFGSPFGDVPDAVHVGRVLADIAQAIPQARLTLADTTGTATPRRIGEVLDVVPAELRDDIGLHLHDSRGLAIANALAGIDRGITRFDTAVGGLGGSPFAPGAGGNLPTEQLAIVAHDLGLRTGIDIDRLTADDGIEGDAG
ncbi:MAG TPA: hypothetical protein PKV27_07085, partial [Ilumatobacteraceae bacterium]|nr:hypothetical protein [Ilumatobacteraceae bacterium]